MVSSVNAFKCHVFFPSFKLVPVATCCWWEVSREISQGAGSWPRDHGYKKIQKKHRLKATVFFLIFSLVSFPVNMNTPPLLSLKPLVGFLKPVFNWGIQD